MADKRLDQTTNASAVAAADNIPFVTAAGVTSYVTGDELAASGPFSSRYKPLASDVIWIGVGDVVASFGSPATQRPVSFASWAFDAASPESVSTTLYFPPSWTTYDVDYIWCNGSASAGNVVWSYYRRAFADGVSIDGVNASGVTATAGAQYIRVTTRVVSGLSCGSTGTAHGIDFVRLADNASDTLANDALWLGALLTRAS